MLADLLEAKSAHKTEAGQACAMYNQRVVNQRNAYLKLCDAYATFRETKSLEALNALVDLAKLFAFGVDSDYQQDKATPFWGKSPQPGPTYFYSKETNYNHIVVAHACGDADGPTRLNRLCFYMRSQQCAGSKDCNDTVFTIFGLLAASTTPACPQPKLFRTGYDAGGVVEAAEAPTAETQAQGAEAQQQERAQAGGEQHEAQTTEEQQRQDARRGWFEEEQQRQTAGEVPLRVSQLTAPALASLVRQAEAWHSQMEPLLLPACTAVSFALERVVASRTHGNAIEVGEILEATRPGPAFDPVAADESAAKIDALAPLALIIRATLAYIYAQRPQCFIRSLDHQMDRCSGTNISQFTFGGFSMALATDAADTWEIHTMVSGHTKFAPDIGANKLANKYNSSDCWSLGHLLEHASLYGSSYTYDEQLLVDLHTAPHTVLFGQVPQVTKLREYLLVADDGQLALGTPAAAPAEQYPGASATAQYYSNEAVERECTALKRRSLLRLLDPSASPRSFGIGSGGSLLPASVTSVRTVICLVKPKEDDALWLLVPSFSSFKADEAGVAKVNAALACTTKPEGKPYYGAKVKQIKEMYSKYVPPNYVPDQFELAASGTSGLVRASVISMMRTPEENAAAEAAVAAKAAEQAAAAAAAAAAAGQGVAGAAAPAPAPAAAAGGKRRWSRHADDDPQLLRLCKAYPTGWPQSSKEWKRVADGMFSGCEPSQCKSAMKRLKAAAVTAPAPATVEPPAPPPASTEVEPPAPPAPPEPPEPPPPPPPHAPPPPPPAPEVELPAPPAPLAPPAPPTPPAPPAPPEPQEEEPEEPEEEVPEASEAEPPEVELPEPCWFKTPGCKFPGKHSGLCSTLLVSGSRDRKRKAD